MEEKEKDTWAAGGGIDTQQASAMQGVRVPSGWLVESLKITRGLLRRLWPPSLTPHLTRLEQQQQTQTVEWSCIGFQLQQPFGFYPPLLSDFQPTLSALASILCSFNLLWNCYLFLSLLRREENTSPPLRCFVSLLCSTQCKSWCTLQVHTEIRV